MTDQEAYDILRYGFCETERLPSEPIPQIYSWASNPQRAEFYEWCLNHELYKNLVPHEYLEQYHPELGGSGRMTIGGALSDLNNLLKADDIPFYYKPSIKAVMDTIALSSSEKPINSPTETLISLDVYKQVAWERDIAIEQLHELGYEFGQKIEPTTNDLGVETIIDELEKEFEKVDIPVKDKLTLFAKVQNALYRCAELNEIRNEQKML